MDGQLADVKSTNDLEIFQEIESDEKRTKKVVQRIVAESQVRMLTDVEELRNYTDEFLDEIIVEMAIVFYLEDFERHYPRGY